MTEDFKLFDKKRKNFYNKSMKKCEKQNNCDLLVNRYYDDLYLFDKSIIGRYQEEILNNIFDLTISSNIMIQCSGEVHSGVGNEKKVINNCEEETQVIETMHSKDFGLCFTYFSKNKIIRNNSMTLKDKDFIKFEVNSKNYDRIVYLSKYMHLFWLIHDSNSMAIPKRENVIRTKETGIRLNYELRYRKTIVEYLSWPYKTDCHHFESKSF
jgi:hypothetical protein